MSEKSPWWAAGVRFACQGSGKCCVSHNGHGYVYLTPEDRRRIARLLKLATGAFTRKFCERHNGIWKIRDEGSACRFLEGKRCGIYEARPTQCRTWPFWPENMQARAWSRNVRDFCPGVGKGPLRSAGEIRGQLGEQTRSELDYGD